MKYSVNPSSVLLNRRARDRQLDQDFLEPAQAILVTPASPVSRSISLVICSLFAVALIVSWLGHVDIYAVAPGRVQPLGRSKVIQPLNNGRVVAVQVRNGSTVRKGQVLVELDSTERTATAAAADDQVEALVAEIERRKLEVAAALIGQLDRPPVLRTAELSPEHRDREQAVLASDLLTLGAKIGGLRAKLAENTAQQRAAEMNVASVEQLMATLRTQVAMRRNLLSQGWESRANVLDVTEQYQREVTALAQAQGEVMQAAVSRHTLTAEIREEIAAFVSDGNQAIAVARGKLDQARQDQVKAALQVRYTRLLSPLDGTVQELDVTTLGQVVTAGQQLMTVVPREGQLEIEALVPNKDIGFLRVGQQAVIKLDAYPFTRYGTITGRVTRVSHDAVANPEAVQQTNTGAQPIQAHSAAASPDPKTQDLVFPVTVKMDQRFIWIDGRAIYLTPGLSATVEIKTGDRRVLEYILSPLVEVTSQAGHER